MSLQLPSALACRSATFFPASVSEYISSPVTGSNETFNSGGRRITTASGSSSSGRISNSLGSIPKPKANVIAPVKAPRSTEAAHCVVAAALQQGEES